MTPLEFVNYFSYLGASLFSVLDSLRQPFADVLAKGTFLTLTKQILPICNGENCSVGDLLNSAACS